jgi:hypothetical protein
VQYKTVISFLVLHKRGAFPLVQEEHRKVHKNKVLRNIFGTEGLEVTEEYT